METSLDRQRPGRTIKNVHTTDYLATENITETDAVLRGGLTKDDVKYAVFRLWITPNDIWARGVLLEYAYFSASGKKRFAGQKIYGQKDGALEWEAAFSSRAMTRVARGVHRYDRYKEPLLIFLTRDLINAEKDLYYQKKKIAKRLQQSAGAVNYDGAADKTVSIAKKLGVKPKKLRALLGEIENRRNAGKPRMGILEMANVLGVTVTVFEDVIFSDAEIFLPAPARPGRGELATASPEDLLFGDYLVRLGNGKPCGEWVSGPPRRAGENADKKFVRPIGVQELQMSKEEMTKAAESFFEYSKTIEAYKQMVKPGRVAEENAGEIKRPLPPVKEYGAWYDLNRTDAWDVKQKQMHMFIYETKYLSGVKSNWQGYDRLYKEQYGERPPVSAKRALPKNIADEFLNSFDG